MRFLLSRGLLFRLLERDYRLQLEIKYLICLSISRHVILLIGVKPFRAQPRRKLLLDEILDRQVPATALAQFDVAF